VLVLVGTRVATSGGAVIALPALWSSSLLDSRCCIVVRERSTRSQSSRNVVLSVMVSVRDPTRDNTLLSVPCMVLNRTSVLLTSVRTLSSRIESIACFFFIFFTSHCSLEMMQYKSGDIICLWSSSFINMVSKSDVFGLVNTSVMSRLFTPWLKAYST